MTSFSDIKRDQLNKSIKLLIEQYTAVSNQILLELNDKTKLVLQEKLNDLKTEITAKQQELDTLNNEKQAPTKPAAAMPAAKIPDRHQLYQTLVNKFSISEMKDLYYRLNIDIEGIVSPNAGRHRLAMELIQYCERRALNHKLIETILKFRPGILF